MAKTKGGFTLPGEAGYEKLTLEMAQKWGADVIRDSDGTKLSDEIVNAGYGIYSTICIIRDHNEWAGKHLDRLQQSFLMTPPQLCTDGALCIDLLAAFFREQFKLNASEASQKYWQVFDRTDNRLLDRSEWSFDEAAGCVTVEKPVPFHAYTVSFLAYRIWEEISMYNHVTNNWNKEHLMPLDPRTQEVQDYLYGWLKQWCESNPDTTVVRFTSLFYNFVWIWGASGRNRSLFTDWGSYDFTVSPEALAAFEQAYGYALTAEDFINMGKLHVTHMPPTKKQLDYMAFTNRFVVDYGKKLVELVHSYGKQAYVFYDDSWVGLEPYMPTFEEFGFDGIIKCIFSGYEVRLCAGVKTPVHEVRLHPYLFPVGLGGAPTFSEGGNPTLDAKKYWNSARRAMLRCKIDRIGLGGYLHLVEHDEAFKDYIEKVADEFRTIRSYHEAGEPFTFDLKVGVLTAWGSLRSWTLSGHFHETYMNDLIHINEALSGMPVKVEYISFEDVLNGAAERFDVIVNAGFAGSAWSGGDNWKNSAVVEKLTAWAYAGGCLIGVGEPGMTEGFATNFRMAQVLGVDKDTGAKCCHGRWSYQLDQELCESLLSGIAVKELADGGVQEKLAAVQATVRHEPGIMLTDGTAQVLAEHTELNSIGELVHTPSVTVHSFGKGHGVYLGHFAHSLANDRLLLNILLSAKQLDTSKYLTDNAACECAYFPADRKLVIINNSGARQSVNVGTEKGCVHAEIEAYDSFETEV